jgi:DNA end-binding protein Ku
LRYADEVNRASSYFRDIGDAKPDPDLLEMAESLIEKKASDFDAKEFENRYIDALKKLIAEKQKKKGKRVIQDEEPERPARGSNVVDLMAALKKSLGDEKPAKPTVKKGAAKPAARRTTKKAAPKRAAGGRGR